MKLGSGDVSFRLGSATPSKVYFGSTEVWSDAPPVPPDAIATVTATASTTSQSAADLSWSAPADNGSAITGYNVYRSTDGGTTFTLVANTANTTYEYIEPYRGGEGRSFNVRAVNAGGEGPNASAYGSANLSDSPPSAPTGLTATALAGYGLRVEFTAPAFTGNQDITDYEIGYIKPPSFSENLVLTGNLTQYTLDFTSTDSGSLLDLRVRAINSVGNGEWSSVVTSPAIGDVPSAPDFFSASTSTTSQGAVSLSISVANGNGSSVTSYDVQYDLDGTFASPTTTNYTDQPGSGAFDKAITGLAGGVLHYARVRFVNAIGNGSWSSSANTYASSTPPGQVTGFSVTPNYGSTAWDFGWTEPATGGSAITGYEVEEAAASTFASPETYYPSSGSGHQETAYDQNVTRYFRIRAINALGNGAWSSTTSSSYNTVISLGIGSGGSGGSGDNNGASGGHTTLSFEGMSLTANGGSGGAGGSGGEGGSATGDMGSSTASGGSGGAGGTGDTGGGGGVAINGSNGYQYSQSPSGPSGYGDGYGGWGANAADFNGLFSRLSSLEIPSTGAGAGADTSDPSPVGGSATGFGGGGGAAGFYGNDGGAGLYGGGGGGAASEGETRTGGAGGAGCVVLEFVTPSGTTQHIVTTGSSYTAPSNATTIRAWAVGGGGGGGGASSGRGASGGGGAGGIAYYQWTR